MPMTLKQAAAFLAATPTPYKLPTLRKAVQSKALKSTLAQAGEIEYHIVEESDLMAWAQEQSKIKRGRKPKKANPDAD